MKKAAAKKTYYAIGLMTGTSMDGMDAALVKARYQGNELYDFKLVDFVFKSYPKQLRQDLLDVCKPGGGTAYQLCLLDAALGEHLSDAVKRLLRKADMPSKRIHIIGSHGQAVQHLPGPVRYAGKRLRNTMQIGQPAIIIQRTGIPVMTHFRNRDMAAGGEGAPLMPYVHDQFFKARCYPMAVHNFGGIQNVTLLPLSGPVSGFDTGPGNILIDGVVEVITKGKQHYDRNGAMALQGKVHHAMLRPFMNMDYFDQAPPKSTGRELFGEAFITRFLSHIKRRKLNHYDAVATATAFTALSSAQQYERFVLTQCSIDEIVCGGGGVKNKALVKWFKQALPTRIKISRWEDYQIKGDAVEAMGFALFALEGMHGNAINIPAVTGADSAQVQGLVTPMI